MAIDVLQAAKHLCMMSEWRLTNLELQKIIYLCHAIFLAEEDRPLVNRKFQAWEYGPVHPDLYSKLKKFGASPIPRSTFRFTKVLNPYKQTAEITVLSKCAETFPHPSVAKLLDITHRDGGAWHRVYRPGIRNIEIPEEFIIEEYEDLKKEYLND